MPIYVAVGDKVEVPGSAMEDPDGFKDSFWQATVIESSGGAKCTVEFDTINETDDEDAGRLKQQVKVTQLRPVPPNDSDEKPPTSREVNDFVDVLYNGGWWQAIVCEIWRNSINVYFPASNEIYTGITKNDERRIRTRYEYTRTSDGNYEFVPRKQLANKWFTNGKCEPIKWKLPPIIAPLVISPPSSSGEEDKEEQEEEKKEESKPSPPAKGKIKKTKTTPSPRIKPEKGMLPKNKNKLRLKHLIEHNYIAPGDDVYVLEHLGCRHGTVMENGSIMVDKNFTTSRDPTAPREYLHRVVPKTSKLRATKTQHWQDVYARLGVDCGVRQLQALRDALFNGQPLPPPLDKKAAPLARSLSGGGKKAAAAASKREKEEEEEEEEEIPSTEEESAASIESEKESENESESDEEEVVPPKSKQPRKMQVIDDEEDQAPDQPEKEKEKEEEKQQQTETQEDSVLASEFFGPSEDEEEEEESDSHAAAKKPVLVRSPRVPKTQPAPSKKVAAAAAASIPAPKQPKKRPASAAGTTATTTTAEKPPPAKKQNKAAATKQVSDLLKDLEDSDAGPSGPILSPLRATKKKVAPPSRFALKSIVPVKSPSAASPSSSSSPASSSSPSRQVAVKSHAPLKVAAALAPKPLPLPAAKQQPALKYLPSMEEKKIWCLDNIPQWILAPALQKALLNEIPTGIINVDMPVVALDSGKFSHPGYAVIRFSTANLAEKAEPVLRQLCIRSSACGIPRPLILRRPWLTKDYPWGKQNTLPGHLPLQMQEPLPAHYAQPNTFEFELAVQWTRLEKTISTARNNLHKEQAYELARVMSEYLNKQHPGKYDGQINEDALHAPPPPPPSPPASTSAAPANRGSSFLWVRGVSPTLKVETLKEVFTQHGYPQRAELLRDKVTKQVNGTALIQMESVDRASRVARNMQDMEFILGGSPRPLQVEIAKPGGPRGSQSVFDRALRAVVGKHDFEPTTLQLIRIPEVIKEDAPLEHRAAVCIRELMTTHRIEQDAARQVAREERAVLAQQQVEQYSVESEKMNRIKALHDGEAYKKMCELHRLAIKRLRHSSPTHLLEGGAGGGK